MKKDAKAIQILLINLIFFLTIFCVPSVSIAGWTQLISPTSQNLNGVSFADASNGICVGDNGTFALTSDGITFQNYSIAGGTNLNGVHYSPDVVGVPAYENLNAYSVTDPAGDPTNVTINGRYEAQVEGMSQEFMDTYVTMDYGAGHFDDTAGYTHYFEYTLSPTNQDMNWVCPWVVADGLLAYNDLNSGYSFCTLENNNGTANAEINNNNTGVAYSCTLDAGYAGPGKRVYGTATVNPGGNAEIRLYQDVSRTTLIPFQGGGCGWPMSVAASAGSYRYIYAIDTDTRAGWSNMNSLVSGNIDINELNLFAAASADNVYRSTSAGAGWYPDTTGSGVQMNDVHFRDDQNGWAVGENGSIYVTSNAGETWIAQSTGSASLQSVFFINANNGWIAGSGGTILYTTNGGSLWQSPVSGVSAVDLYDIHFVSTTVGWAVGFNGTIIKTTDGGVNWVAQTSGTTNQLNGVHFVDANTGYAAGVNDTILKTTDGGTTWIPQTSPSLGNNFNDLYFIDANTGYICGDGGAILRTTDGGAGAAGNQIVMHPTASTATDQFALSGCASSFDCVNDQPGNAATGYALAVNNDGPFYLNGDNGNQVLFDLADSGSVGIPAGSTIDSIEIFAQAYRENALGGATYRLSYDIGGGLISEPAGTALVRGNYQMMSYAWSSLSWTTAQLDSLKIGVVQSGNSTSYLGQLYATVTFSQLPNTPPVGGYSADDIIPAAQVIQSTDGSGIITVSWKVRDNQPDLVTLLNFEYSDDGGATWYTPTIGDASASLSAGWNDNGGSGWSTGTLFSNAPVHTFTFDTKHADLSGRLGGVDQSDVRIRFTLNDGTVNSVNPAISESFRVDNLIPASTITSASYEAATDTLTITGTNFLSIDPATTDIKDYVDWTKFIWDTNGDDATTADISVALADVTSLTITDDTTLSLVFTGAKGTSIEATAGYGGAGGLDTIDVNAGFIKDEFGNTATTDEVTDGPLDVEAPSAISDLAINGFPTSSTVGLTWTSPGDDLNSGIAATYDIRYSTSPINDGNWAAATQAAGEPSPQVPGSTEYFTVAGLNQSQIYYFAIKASDEIPKESALSNVVNATTGIPPSGTYYWQRPAGGSVAGFSESNVSCGDRVSSGSMYVTSMSGGDYDCDWIRFETSGSPQDLMLMISDAPYSGSTSVTGVNFSNNFVDDNGGGVIVRYELGYAIGGVFTSWGSVDTPNWDSGLRTDDLRSISGIAPSGSHLAFKIIQVSSGQLRMWPGNNYSPSGILNVTEVEEDGITPDPITDLVASLASPTSIDLTWTAPGDDGSTGTASLYDIRYLTSPITDANWATATQAVGEPAPQVAGSSEAFTVTGLTAGQTYYFAIKTRDEVPNISLLSNVATRGFNITGRVFEDLDYSGGAGTAYDGGVTDVGLSGVEVELYDASDNWVKDADAVTAADGTYTISNVANGNYRVRVRSATITVKGAGTLPEQTYEYDGTTGNGSNGALGGNDSQADDTATGDNNSGGAGDTNVTVTVSGTVVSGIDFGFSYNLITNTRNSGQGSLRQFIANANTIAGPNSSQFFIPDTDPNLQTAGANSWWRITPFSALPSLSDNNTTLDGSTQSANYGSDSNSIGPEIEIVGTSAGGGANGITVSSDNNTVAGLIINRFSWNGIMINGSGNRIWGNWLGIDATGVIDQGNSDNGIEVNGSNNTVGGSSDIERNVISGNTDEGIDINPGIPGTIIIGNYIGTDYTGTASIPNGQAAAGHWGGVLVEGDNSIIGGSLPGEGNVISGNYQWGLYISSNGNTVLGNYIGTDALGTSALGNMGLGIEIDGAFGGSNNTVGGVSAGEGNSIGYNTGDGIRVNAGAGTGNLILGNTISDNTANGVNSNADSVNIIKNLIVSNGAGATDGVRIDTGGTNNKIYHNTIHGNADDGIIVYANGTIIRNNVITGHSGNGLQILGGSMSESNNLITDAVTNPPNGTGASNTSLNATTITTQDPQYVNSPADDYTLTECTSPAVDAGLDLGGDQPDMNGATAGLWNGAAPDAGAFESSCGISLSIVKQIWEVGGAAPLASPITLPQNGRYVFLIYVKNTTAGSVSDVRISDALDDTAFQYIAGSLHRDDGSLSDGATDLAIFNATKPPGRGGPGVSMSDAVDGDITSAQDTGGPADVDSITIGTVPVQSNGTLNISGNTTFAIRFEVFIK